MWNTGTSLGFFRFFLLSELHRRLGTALSGPANRLVSTMTVSGSNLADRYSFSTCRPKREGRMNWEWLANIRLNVLTVVLSSCWVTPAETKLKRHRKSGITRSSCDLFVWEERNTSSTSSFGKFSHRAQPVTTFWHPCP